MVRYKGLLENISPPVLFFHSTVPFEYSVLRLVIVKKNLQP